MSVFCRFHILNSFSFSTYPPKALFLNLLKTDSLYSYLQIDLTKLVINLIAIPTIINVIIAILILITLFLFNNNVIKLYLSIKYNNKVQIKPINIVEFNQIAIGYLTTEHFIVLFLHPLILLSQLQLLTMYVPLILPTY